MNKILMALMLTGSLIAADTFAAEPIPTVQILYDPSGPATLLNSPLHFDISASGIAHSLCSGNLKLSTTAQMFSCPALLNVKQPVTLDLKMSMTPPLAANCASISFSYQPGQIILVGITDAAHCGAIATTPTQSSASKRK